MLSLIVDLGFDATFEGIEAAEQAGLINEDEAVEAAEEIEFAPRRTGVYRVKAWGRTATCGRPLPAGPRRVGEPETIEEIRQRIRREFESRLIQAGPRRPMLVAPRRVRRPVGRVVLKGGGAHGSRRLHVRAN